VGRAGQIDQIRSGSPGGPFLARILALMSALSLLLATPGVCSLMAYVNARRTQEIGVRMALGASRWDVMRLVSRHALAIAASGAIVGAALGYLVGRVMDSTLFGLGSVRPWLVIGVVVGLGVVTLAAGMFPARRAARPDPATALRAE
jgi:ABC-type antimicrobial peptide transport system permease subunit